ncbi:NADH:ubiquinone reductase (Na(+)-transporting) subunit B [Saccharicrinis fermentans]|uniref:Na(+)-translocating NADH-quinone reductase subunit B n=1 Tax=Saccharicrinis fermentans DSM 9555 = JCM 21142 TaxID=869213 RepID=W7YMG6_9BACT|nr:NADH:ubiquinone reductase (Na(+)-transporting) subunit B [Saccharicrinis fermentans]GAF03574.1 Na(+)-translocating NADH-quinone reductase subunit B [Saccharicrinis fermentans DSM 9555 = JCM 21142]
MKALRQYLDKIKPNFEKGGKFEKLHSSFDAFETLLFVPKTTSKNGVHIHDAIDSKRTMAVVVLALIPALLFGIWNTGYQHFLATGQAIDFWPMVGYGALKVLPIVVVSYVVGLGIEFMFAQLRGHEVAEGFLVSGMLIPLVLPADVPLWMVAVATAFSVIIGKEVFGGTGMNIWNPALIARAFLFFAYPSKMSGDLIWVSGMSSGEGIVDGYSGATALGNAAIGKMDLFADGKAFDLWNSFIGTIPGSIGETSTLAILIGAIVLLATGIGSWKIMLSVFAGGFLMALGFNAIGANELMSVDPLQQLCLGGFAFGAVFMATDPVSGARTEKGKFIYGFLVGVFAIMIRVFNPAYPEGVMLAILLMNTFAPLIDHLIVQQNIKRRLKRVKVNA